MDKGAAPAQSDADSGAHAHAHAHAHLDSRFLNLHAADVPARDARDAHPGMGSPSPSPPPRLRSPLPRPRDGSHSSCVYPVRNPPGSSPALSIRTRDNDEVPASAAAPILIAASTAPPQPSPSAASSVPTHPPSSSSGKSKASKKRLPQVLGRSKSLHSEDQLNGTLDPKSKAKLAPKRSMHGAHSNSTSAAELMSRNGLSDKDRNFRDIIKSSLRDRPQDRALAEAEANRSKPRKDRDKEKDKAKDRDLHPLSSSYRANNSSAFFTDFRQSSSRATDGITKAGKGFFNKFTRSGSHHEKPAATSDEDHVPRILTLPLIEQTRITRIAKSYDHCKDKTEFWMPALPWRCIDYLNGKCEEEGLYRVSGGLTKVKEWRKRFDMELDVNLLDETELYDASIIASLFKEWIRELPEEIFPKDAQARVVQQLPSELPGKGFVPEILRRELQQLPPFHYYLLFAITCHLSLLLSYESKNKMTLDNLYRCFNQSLRLDGRIFYTLVGEWRQCWAGCLTENDYLKTEYDYLQHPYPQFIQDSLDGRPDERAISSSESSAPPANGDGFVPEVARPATSYTLLSQSPSDAEEHWITPVKKNKRSSSDVTGMSPMRFNASPLHRG